MCPDREDPHAYPQSFASVGPALAQLWGVPEDEQYARHGVLVHEGQPTAADIRELEKRLSDLLDRSMRLTEIKLKTHLPHSRGVWLHTDRRADRQVQVLLYLTSLKAKDGAELVLFSRITEPVDCEVRHVNSYISRGPLGNLKSPIHTAGIGGEWDRRSAHTFAPRLRVRAKKNRAVILDYRKGRPNIHAVPRLEGDATRQLVEMWFTQGT